MTIEEMRALLDDLNTQAIEIQAKADVEKRDLTEEEAQSLQAKLDEFDKTEDSLKLRIKIEEQTKRMKNLGEDPDDPPSQRQTTPDVPGARAGDSNSEPTRHGTIHVRERILDDTKRGWQRFGDFASAVHRAHTNQGVDDRLTRTAATTFGQESIGADGGYAVPPGFADSIAVALEDEESLLALSTVDDISSSSMTYPKDEATPWGTTGIIAAWEGEGGTQTERKLALESSTIKAHKLISLVKVTDELLEDARTLDTYISRKASSAIRHKVDLAIVQGSGAGQPLGFRDGPGTISPARAGSNLVAGVDVRDMWVRLYGPWRRNAVWLANQDVEPQLMSMILTPGALTDFPVYIPPGGFSGAPFSTLMGKRVIFTQACDSLGSKGDIALVALDQFQAVQRGGGIRASQSIHLHFDQDIQSFKFVHRLGGQPMWAAAISPRDGSTTYSAFVVLAA